MATDQGKCFVQKSVCWSARQCRWIELKCACMDTTGSYYHLMVHRPDKRLRFKTLHYFNTFHSEFISRLSVLVHSVPIILASRHFFNCSNQLSRRKSRPLYDKSNEIMTDSNMSASPACFSKLSRVTGKRVHDSF